MVGFEASERFMWHQPNEEFQKEFELLLCLAQSGLSVAKTFPEPVGVRSRRTRVAQLPGQNERQQQCFVVFI